MNRIEKTLNHFKNNVPSHQNNMPSMVAWFVCEQFPEWEPLLGDLPQTILDNLKSIIRGDNRYTVKLGQIHLQLVSQYNTDKSAGFEPIDPEVCKKAISLISECFSLLSEKGILIDPTKHPMGTLCK